MRLGGKVFESFDGPDEWVQAVQDLGYRAAYCPVGPDADDETVEAYSDAAERGGIVIAEVGAWSNTIDPNPEGMKKNIEKCQENLDLAERIGARCCVNIVGSRGEKWNGPSPENVTRDTFDLVVEVIRKIVDAVKPKRTAYTLETSMWGLPDSAEVYLELIEAVDRDGFAAHFDPVNMINSPRRYYDNAKLMAKWTRLLGPHIRSVHAKDVTLAQNHLVHLDECRPGTGALDYRTLIRELDRLDPDTPVMLEHLPDAEEYKAAAEHLRAVAKEEGVTL